MGKISYFVLDFRRGGGFSNRDAAVSLWGAGRHAQPVHTLKTSD